MASPFDPGHSSGNKAPIYRISVQQREHGCVAIVDDDNGIAEAIAGWLEFEGIAHAIFESAESMLEALSTSAQGLEIKALNAPSPQPLIGAIIDINLPGQNGLVLSDNLRQLAPTLPLVNISAMRPSDLNKFGSLKSDIPFLSKPFELSALENALLDL
jgi:FixJ family two-component response regulator